MTKHILSRFTLSLGAALALASACGPAGEAPPSASDPTVDQHQRAYESMQGTKLQGGALTSAAAFSSYPGKPAIGGDGVAFDSLSAGPGVLLARRGLQTMAVTDASIPMFSQITLSGTTSPGTSSQNLNLRITDVQKHVNPYGKPAINEYEYRVEYWNGFSYRPLCGGTGRAMVLDGVLSGAGNHSFVTGSYAQFSFVCGDGVAVKCVNWGYKPWLTYPGMGPAGSGKTPWDYHGACTRMARADYCGDGVSHTLNGTPIDLYDALPAPVNASSNNPTLYPEAAWVPGPRVGALCLSKQRWDTIPLGGLNCPSLPDPRLQANKYNPLAVPCESRPTLTDWANNSPPALIFNDSAFLDAGLYRWGGPGGDSFTTARYVDRGLLGVYPATPHTAQSGVAYKTPARFEGTVFNAKLDATFLSKLPGGVTPLYSYVAGDDAYTTTQGGAPGYVQTALEGYIYRPDLSAPAGAVPLFTWYNGAVPDYLTTTDPAWSGIGLAPGTSHGADGYVFVRLEGYLPR